MRMLKYLATLKSSFEDLVSFVGTSVVFLNLLTDRVKINIVP